MSLCEHLSKDSEIGQKILEISNKLSGTAKDQIELTELTFMINGIIRENEKLKKCVEFYANSAFIPRQSHWADWCRITDLDDIYDNDTDIVVRTGGKLARQTLKELNSTPPTQNESN